MADYKSEMRLPPIQSIFSVQPSASRVMGGSPSAEDTSYFLDAARQTEEGHKSKKFKKETREESKIKPKKESNKKPKAQPRSAFDYELREDTDERIEEADHSDNFREAVINNKQQTRSSARLADTKDGYENSIIIQTDYVAIEFKRLGKKHGYTVKRISQNPARPPVDGDSSKLQGQHKIPYVAIVNGLQTCVGKSISDAKEAINRMYLISGAPRLDFNTPINVAQNISAPPELKDLTRRASDYLSARQCDNPAWPVDDNDPHRKEKLAGKGEVAIKGLLDDWRKCNDEARGKELLAKDALDQLADASYRNEAEAEDAVDRAYRELQIQNEELFKKLEPEIKAWGAKLIKNRKRVPEPRRRRRR